MVVVGADDEVLVLELGVGALDDAEDVRAADERRLGRRGDGHLGARDVHRGGLHGRLDLLLQLVDRLARALEEEVRPSRG